MAVLVLAAVAPAVALDYGINSSLIGYQISLISFGMMLTLTLLGNTSKRYGAARTNQIGHAFIASGILILLTPWLPFLIVGSLIIGLGYGMITPSASHLLMRYTLPHRRSTVFSIHQIGIPAGGILASSIAPAITVYTSWHWAVLFSASLLVCVVLLMQVRRHHWDDDRDQSAAIITANPFAGTQAIWAHPKLRLATLAGSCFSWVQFCTATFTVVACVSVLQMDLLIAGTVLSVVQLSSAAGRVLMGWIVDRINNTTIVLGFNAAILIIATIATLFLTPELPLFAIYILFAVLGATSGSWPGVLLSEVGRLAPSGNVSLAISGSLVITNVGKFLGPIIFVNMYAYSQQYTLTFAALTVPAVIALYSLYAAQQQSEQTT